MFDKITPSSSPQPTAPTGKPPAHPSFERLVGEFEEWRKGWLVAAELEEMPIIVGGRAVNDLIGCVPATRRHALVLKRPDGSYQVLMAFGLSAEEADARAKELASNRAATGLHLWS